MSVFDTLAEIRYEEWLEKVSAADYQPPEKADRTAVRQSYEAYLFSEVMLHLDKADEASSARQRDDLLEKARQLEFQLMLLLEKRALPLVASTLSSTLAARRKLTRTHCDRKRCARSIPR